MSLLLVSFIILILIALFRASSELVNFFAQGMSSSKIAQGMSSSKLEMIKDSVSSEICRTCSQAFEVKSSNKGNGLFMTCPACKARTLGLGKVRKKEVVNTYIKLNSNLHAQASLVKGNEYLINADHEFERLLSFSYNNSIEKGTLFEIYVAKILQLNGFNNVKLMPVGPDDGIDITADLNDKKYGIQCKFYDNTKVSNQQVLQFFGAIANGKFDFGIFITTSDFTRSASSLKVLKEGNILLLNYFKFYNNYISNLRSKIKDSVIYHVICENYRCNKLVEHKLIEETCKCSECGKQQYSHVHYLHYFI